MEERIIAILREQEAGVQVTELCANPEVSHVLQAERQAQRSGHRGSDQGLVPAG